MRDPISPVVMPPDQAAELQKRFRFLANITRLRLLHALQKNGETPVLSLADALGASVQAVSNQLRLMEASHLVSSRRDGRQVFYRVNDGWTATLIAAAMDEQKSSSPS